MVTQRRSQPADSLDEAVERWRTVRPDLDWSGSAALARLVRVAALVNRQVEAAVAAHGLTAGEFDLLSLLRAGAAGRPMSISELGAQLLLSAAAMTHRVDRLEAAGLVLRQRVHPDRRNLSLLLTERGRTVVETAVADRLAAEQRILAALSPVETARMDAVLRRLSGSLSAD
ncbi:MarR family winged helix-turn-helix transcriptional regulator [Nakamurella endophytica]|nr:MarR family transcriptional regulator [Nakamurella endophytica]